MVRVDEVCWEDIRLRRQSSLFTVTGAGSLLTNQGISALILAVNQMLECNPPSMEEQCREQRGRGVALLVASS